MSILDQIVSERRAAIAREGHSAGARIPSARAVPVIPFGAPPFLVCEVKRRSPSRGDIAPGLDAVAQARLYAQAGVRSISVLTERDHFGGSLEDLMRIKEALPGMALLRKDFLVDLEDVEISHRAGADAVLLIASILEAPRLSEMYGRARELGMEALVEVHDREDVEKCRQLQPRLTGINCRDLSTFSVDRLDPLALRPRIDWGTRLVFESGVRTGEDVLVARAAGFEGVLVGETVMRSPETAAELLGAFGKSSGNFWGRLAARRRPGRPLVKICGITRPGDALMAAELGADALGFVFAPSKRRAEPELLRGLRGLGTLKVAVVVTDGAVGRRARLDAEVEALLADGLVDAVQLHGNESPEECAGMAFPYYKAVRVREAADVEAMRGYRCPRVLADAYAPHAAGGTGQRVPAELARLASESGPLWLAGGLGPENVADAVKELSPELIDASSALEESPGCKDKAALTRFFEEIDRHGEV